MKKEEAKVTPKIMKWFASTVPHSCPFEIKHTRGKNTFNLTEIAQHQYDYLYAATTRTGCTYKIPDAGFRYNPFDVMHYKKSKAYVIIVYPKRVYAIEIRKIMKVENPIIDEKTAYELAAYVTTI